MSLHHRVLSASYLPVKWARRAGRGLGMTSPDALRVLNHHDVPPSDLDRFAEQLRWLGKSWKFISPEEFGAMASGERPVLGRNLLLTFDDGFASNRVAAERVLNPMKIRALFFIISDFAAFTDREASREFIASRIQPTGVVPEDLPDGWRNMQWTDLAALLEQGHAIGGHTRTHAALSAVNGEGLAAEIAESADSIESQLGARVEHFAFPFGNLASFTPEAMRLARGRFRFVHSGLRGDNRGGVSPFAIRRDAAAMQDAHSDYRAFPHHLIGAFLEGAADLRYSRDRDQLDQWARC